MKHILKWGLTLVQEDSFGHMISSIFKIIF